MKPRAFSDRFALIVLATGAMYLGSCPGSWASEGPSVEDVVRVFGKKGGGHACPLRGGYLVTSAHVMEAMSSLRWSDGLGNEGTAELVREMGDADLAVLRVTRGHVGREFLPALTAPRPGDRVVLRGWRYDSRKQVLAERRVETKVTRIEAGHLLFEDAGMSGSSGSCVFNAQGEVVAINKGGVQVDTGDQLAGLAVAIWGDWATGLLPEESTPSPFPQPRPLTDGPPKE